VLVPALFFVAGFSLIFLILGASATLIGQVFKVYQDWIARIGGLLIIVFGLHLLGVLRFGTLMRERRVHLARSPAGYAGAVVTGAAFGAGWTPCLGPVLGALLTYASARATLAEGMLLLGSYSLGLAVPFLIAAAATGFFLNASKRLRGGDAHHREGIRRGAGVRRAAAGERHVHRPVRLADALHARLHPGQPVAAQVSARARGVRAAAGAAPAARWAW
jgi:cytochrome c-type biogenesis protein